MARYPEGQAVQLVKVVPQLGTQVYELMVPLVHGPQVAEQPALAACCPKPQRPHETPDGAQVHSLHVRDQWHVSSQAKAWQTPQLTPPTVVEVVPRAHSPEPVHALTRPHLHALEHVRERVPQKSQEVVSTSPAVHSPMPVHAPTGPHVQLGRHVCVRIPQRSQGMSRRCPGVHSHAPHTPDSQRPPAAQGLVPGQHASPGPPHARQNPASVQSSPTLQPMPAQQGSPTRPQVRHVPPWQTSTPVHGVAPAQHGRSTPPHAPESIANASRPGASGPRASIPTTAASSRVSRGIVVLRPSAQPSVVRRASRRMLWSLNMECTPQRRR
jgi:hypothetical protein